MCDLIVGKSSTSLQLKGKTSLGRPERASPPSQAPHCVLQAPGVMQILCCIHPWPLSSKHRHTHKQCKLKSLILFMLPHYTECSSRSQHPGPVYQAIIIPVILWASVWQTLLQTALLTAWPLPHHPCRPLPVYSTLICSHFFTLLFSFFFFLLFYFLNYESMITHLQETGKILNKVTYSSTI